VQVKESLNKEETKDELNNNNIKPNDKKEQPMLIGTPIFFNTIPTIPKYCYNKMYKRKTKVFTEREGDWVCNNCKNLNFAFRVECNRCHLQKDYNEKKEVPNENIKENKENQEHKGYKKNHKYKKGNNYYGKNKGNEKGKE
jgi:aspartate-semialdehyde dehydrogenase